LKENRDLVLLGKQKIKSSIVEEKTRWLIIMIWLIWKENRLTEIKCDVN